MQACRLVFDECASQYSVTQRYSPKRTKISGIIDRRTTRTFDVVYAIYITFSGESLVGNIANPAVAYIRIDSICGVGR